LTTVYDEAFWEDLYRARDAIWSGQPNAQLLTEVSDLPAGRALDVGCGEGADALWLGARGWQVTAVDISPTALERAQSHAARAGKDVAGRITWVHADLTSDITALSTYDLVTAQFMHVPSAQRVRLYGELARSVAPGGRLLIVGHSPDDHVGDGHGDRADLLFTGEQVAATLDTDSWDVLVSEDRERTVLDAEGGQRGLRDTVVHARRRQ
jgi:SAM-dependent methyltransferase